MSPRRRVAVRTGSHLLPDKLGTEHDPKKRVPGFRNDHAPGKIGGRRRLEEASSRSVERIPLMNPADVAVLPMPAADVSLIALFLQAHWVVKAVMMGLLACSVWVWAI